MELTTENMNKLIEWQQRGDRAVKIEIDKPSRLLSTDKHISVWCYDYDETDGINICEIDELPTVEFFREMALESKRKEIKELEDRLNSLKEKK